jgi:translation initiation factor 1
MTKPKDPFAELEKLRAQLPPGPAPAPPKTPKAPPPPKVPARAVVRMERKGRGGKEVTIIALARSSPAAPPDRRGPGVDKLALPPAELERWCRDLKQALGCGGAVDGDLIVLQGDLRSRIGAVLESRGVSRVTIG